MVRAAALTVLLAAVAAPTAHAAPWKRVTIPDGGSTDPVKGAKVKVAGKSGTTDSRGRVTLTVKARRKLAVRASRSGYAGASRRVGVRR
jgi:hypothetical protein